MTQRIEIRETGEVIELPAVEIRQAMPLYTLDGREFTVPDALARLEALCTYWKQRCQRYETTLADLRAEQAVNR